MKQKLSMAMSLAVILAMLLTSLALADGFSADADAFVLLSPHANSLTAIQKGGTTVSYPFSAVINDTGNDKDNVFPGTVTVSITRTGAWSSGGTNSFNLTAYGEPNSGTIDVTVPCGANGTSQTMTISLNPGAGAGGNTVNPDPISLSYTITADVDDVSCAPPPPSDTTPPVITPAISGTLGNNGWYTSDVTVTWSVVDNESAISSSSGCDATTINTETAGVTLTCSATSAGGTSSQSVSIKRDATAPTISGSASPAANGFGWNNTDVAVTFTCGDNLSGVASCGPGATITSEGANQSVNGTAVDNAGNSAGSTVSGINIDKTAPSVSLVGGPAEGGSYYFGFVPASPTCSASDGLSGLNGDCSVSGYAATVGTHTVTASASDKAGNSASASATYTVLAWTLKGFYSPVDMNGVYNVVKGGSTVPLKFEVFAGSTELTSTSVVASFTQTKIACDGTLPADDIEFVTTGGTSLRYDSTAGQFIQNWQTPKLPGQCYRVTMTTQDGSSLIAFFKLK